MTDHQFRTILTRIGLSQVQAAHVLGVTPRTARRYALGEVKVPPPVAKLLKLIKNGSLTPQQVRTA